MKKGKIVVFKTFTWLTLSPPSVREKHSKASKVFKISTLAILTNKQRESPLQVICLVCDWLPCCRMLAYSWDTSMTRLLFAQNNWQWKQLLTSKLLQSNKKQKTPDGNKYFCWKAYFACWLLLWSTTCWFGTCTIKSSEMKRKLFYFIYEMNISIRR